MNKITMGTGIGVVSIEVDGVVCKPMGEQVSIETPCVYEREKDVMELVAALVARGWADRGHTHNRYHRWMVPPAGKYRCVSYSGGYPECDGSQTIEYE